MFFRAILAAIAAALIVAISYYLAAELGVADVFDDRPKTSAQLATAANTEPRSLYRLLHALASVGIFNEVSDRTFIDVIATTIHLHIKQEEKIDEDNHDQQHHSSCD